MIERHTGKGLNIACDCEFCIAKRQATHRMGSTRILIKEARERGEMALWCHSRFFNCSPDTISDWICRMRNSARRQIRIQLRELKEK